VYCGKTAEVVLKLYIIIKIVYLHLKVDVCSSCLSNCKIRILCNSESTSTLKMALMCGLFVSCILLNYVNIITGLPEQGVRTLRLYTVNLQLLTSKKFYM